MKDFYKTNYTQSNWIKNIYPTVPVKTAAGFQGPGVFGEFSSGAETHIQ